MALFQIDLNYHFLFLYCLSLQGWSYDYVALRVPAYGLEEEIYLVEQFFNDFIYHRSIWNHPHF